MNQKSLFNIPAKQNDIVYTPDDVARDIVEFFKPTGRILDPCKGEGAFLKYMPGAEWCEIREGRDFFDYTQAVDWIVGNPPYSIFSEWNRHSFKIADNVVYLIPINKAFNSERMLREIYQYGGITTIYAVGGGHNTHIRWKCGFALGAVHFKRGYSGGITVVFRSSRIQAVVYPDSYQGRLFDGMDSAAEQRFAPDLERRAEMLVAEN